MKDASESARLMSSPTSRPCAGEGRWNTGKDRRRTKARTWRLRDITPLAS